MSRYSLFVIRVSCLDFNTIIPYYMFLGFPAAAVGSTPLAAGLMVSILTFSVDDCLIVFRLALNV